jgi:hypothetical protein
MNTPNDESGFQPLLIDAIQNLGRWPRLIWYWAFGPSSLSDLDGNATKTPKPWQTTGPEIDSSAVRDRLPACFRFLAQLFS